MIRNAFIILAINAAASGCAYSIKDIDVSDLEPSCVRECSTSYSSSSSVKVVGT